MLSPRTDDGFIPQEVIRPAAVLSETNARLILTGLERDDVRFGGHWWATAGMWRRYDQPWGARVSAPGDSTLLGSISCVYDSPARFWVTVFRVSLTSAGLRAGWSTDALCNEAFAHAGLTLADCPRATLTPRQDRSIRLPVTSDPLDNTSALFSIAAAAHRAGPMRLPDGPLVHTGTVSTPLQ